MIKYTLKSFIYSLIGDYKAFLQLRKDMDFEPYLLWDGKSIIIFNETNWALHNDCFDCISFTKNKNYFILDLASYNYWYFKIQFKGKGLQKNKQYKIRDFYAKTTK